MESPIEEVKNRIDIVGLISEYVTVKKAGRNFKALCPFHPEKTPSFMISPERQIFKCFGCNEGGDVFAFIKRSEGMEFGEALKFLADKAGVKLPDYKPGGEEKLKETVLEANRLTSELYHYLLVSHSSGKRALDYLKARRITDKSIKDFQIGFSPGGNDTLVKFLTKRGFIPKDLITAGLILPSFGKGMYDRFRDRITFPIRSLQGKVIGFSARSLGSNQPKYMNSPETPVFSKSGVLFGMDRAKGEIKKQNEAVLVEGNIDVVSSHQVGITNVVAPLGTSLTEKQLEILRRFTETLLISFDTDIAGDAAAKRGIDMAEKIGMNIKVVQLTEGKDPDEIIRNNPNLWKESLKKPIPVYDYYINSAIKGFGTSDPYAKKKIAKEVLPQIAKINDEIVKAHYINKLSGILGVEDSAVATELGRYKFSAREEKSPQVKPEIISQTNLLEKYLLALIIQSGDLPKGVGGDLFGDAELKDLFDLIRNQVKKIGKVRIRNLGNQMPEALLAVFDELILLNIGEEILEFPERIKKEIISCVKRIKSLNLRAELKDLSLAIKQQEIAGSEGKTRQLVEKFQKLSSGLVEPEQNIS